MLYERSPRNSVARSPWAIKKLNKRVSAKSEYAKRLEEEAGILEGLDHPNIIGYRGFKRNEDGSLILATENGHKALYDVLEEIQEAREERFEAQAAKKSSAEKMDSSVTVVDDEEEEEDVPIPLTEVQMTTVLRSVASALDYLHSEKRLLHGDIKSSNILVIGDFEEVKLCDFGVTLPLDEHGVVCATAASQGNGEAKLVPEVRQYIGTEPWAAKEVIEGLPITTKTDIFALGCTIFEMLTGESPHINLLKMGDEEGSGEDGDGKDDSADVDDSEYLAALGTRPRLPDFLDEFMDNEDYQAIFALFYACTAEKPEQRPSAKAILDILAMNDDDDEVIDVSSTEELGDDDSDEDDDDDDDDDDTDDEEDDDRVYSSDSDIEIIDERKGPAMSSGLDCQRQVTVPVEVKLYEGSAPVSPSSSPKVSTTVQDDLEEAGTDPIPPNKEKKTQDGPSGEAKNPPLEEKSSPPEENSKELESHVPQLAGSKSDADTADSVAVGSESAVDAADDKADDKAD